jgi:peptide/nickel transport system substrate-binding protein
MSDEQAVQRQLTRRDVLYLGGGLGIALAGGPAAFARAADAATRADRPLKVGVTGDVGGWDQDYVAFNLVALMLFKNNYPYVIDYGTKNVAGAQIADTQNFINVYAQSFTPSQGGRVWALKLKQGVKWPSGNEVTAEDIKWSKDRAFVAQANVAGVYRLIGLTKPSQVQVVDKYTVRFTQAFPSPLAPQIHAIGTFFFDSKLLKQHATKSDPWAKDWANKNPQNGGAYNVTSYTPGQTIVLEANPNYPGPKAKIKQINISIIPSPANLRLQLQKGDIDIALPPGLSRRDIQQLKKAKGVKVISVPSNEFVTIDMSVVTPPFDNVLVRQAMAYAVPYDQILKDVYNGDARRSRSPVPLDMPGFTPAGYPYTHDLVKASALLKQAGKSNIKSELVIEANNPEQQQIAILVANELKKVGINLDIKQLDPATLSQRRTKKDIPLQVTTGILWVNDVEYLLAVELTKSAFLNYSNYSSPQIEAIFTKMHSTFDKAKRNSMAHQVQAILAKDVPWLMIAQPNFNLPVRSNIAGWVQPVDELARLRYLSEA